jgi:hypothetical protein
VDAVRFISGRQTEFSTNFLGQPSDKVLKPRRDADISSCFQSLCGTWVRDGQLITVFCGLQKSYPVFSRGEEKQN